MARPPAMLRPSIYRRKKENMKTIHTSIKTAVRLFASLGLLVGVALPAAAQKYSVHQLVSDVPIPGESPPPLLDADLVNRLGISHGSTSPRWASDNGNLKSTIYAHS